MIDYIKSHERYIREMLAKNLDRKALLNLLHYHDKQIQWLQHERFVHLITMLFVCLFMLLTFGYTILMPSLPCMILSALLMILSVAYIIHYYRLENGVQRWYSLSNQIKLNHLL
jgi:hypothetical protein